MWIRGTGTNTVELKVWNLYDPGNSPSEARAVCTAANGVWSLCRTGFFQMPSENVRIQLYNYSSNSVAVDDVALVRE